MTLQALQSSGCGMMGGAEGPLAPPKFSVDVPFFADSPLNVLFLKKVTNNIHENQQAKSRAS